MKMNLCKPCAMGLVAERKSVKQVAARCEKITCAQCGRRRYGVTYEVTEKPREGSKK